MLPAPTAHRLIGYFQLTANLTVIQPFAEELDRQQSTLFQRLEVTLHPTWVAHVDKTLGSYPGLRYIMRIIRYIMRGSIEKFQADEFRNMPMPAH
jgi:hypothetical protein